MCIIASFASPHAGPGPLGADEGVDDMAAKMQRISLLQKQLEDLKRMKEMKATHTHVSPSPIQPPTPSPTLTSPSPGQGMASMHDAFWGPPTPAPAPAPAPAPGPQGYPHMPMPGLPYYPPPHMQHPPPPHMRPPPPGMGFSPLHTSFNGMGMC
jgi:hypothetical protein